MKKILLTVICTCLAACSEQGTTQNISEPLTKADILFDASHGVTAGEADWVIDGAFSTFNDNINQAGYKTTATHYDTLITYDLLKQYDGYIIPEANIPFKKSEQDAIVQYVKSGGSVMFISDHYNADRNLNRFDASEIFNGYRRGAYEDITKGLSHDEKTSDRMKDVESSDFLNENFGVRFRYNALDDVVLKANEENNVFKIMDGVNKVNMHAGSTIMITKPEMAKGLIYPGQLSSRDKWDHAVDQGIYTEGGTDEGAFVAISKTGKGKAVFIGDSSIVEDSTPKYKREDNGNTKQTYDGINEMDHSKLMDNLVKWMMTKETYETFKGKITLDEKTEVLPFEKPEASTEPKKEPWGNPGRGYKWYDPRTFAEGSFGSKGNEKVTPVPGSEKNDRSNNSSKNNNNNNSNKNNTTNNNQTNQNSSNTTIKDGDLEVSTPKNVSPGEYVKININSKVQLNGVSISITDDQDQQMGLFNGRPPGESNAYDMQQRNGVYNSYFNGKIAREARGSLKLNIYADGKLQKVIPIDVR